MGTLYSLVIKLAVLNTSTSKQLSSGSPPPSLKEVPTNTTRLAAVTRELVAGGTTYHNYMWGQLRSGRPRRAALPSPGESQKHRQPGTLSATMT